MEHGSLSERASQRLFGDTAHSGLRVTYTEHHFGGCALDICDAATGQRLGSYVSIGPKGIIPSGSVQGEPGLGYNGPMEHTNRVGGFGMDTDGLEDDEPSYAEEMESEVDDDEDFGDVTSHIPEPPSPKDQFLTLVQQIIALNGNSGAVYERLEQVVAPFDKELAGHLRACKVADDRLIAYCQKKMEGR
jgi:hypothetical protein